MSAEIIRLPFSVTRRVSAQKSRRSKNGTPEERAAKATADAPNMAPAQAILDDRPAPDAAAVKWKQMALARGQHRFTDVKSERIERAIADDLAFLAAHPVRQSSRRSAKEKG
jgi:hypothetical protein